jgi:predicted deacylase
MTSSTQHGRRQTRRIDLPSPAPGTAHSLLFHCYGQAGSGPKAYIQASLHADETPGLLTAHHLVRRLDAAAAEGAITGHIVVAPYANPIGLGQFVNGSLLGRYELGGGGNFNRHWPDLFTPVVERLDGRLSQDAAANVTAIRAAMAAAIDEIRPDSAFDHLRKTLTREAFDADLLLDLHCDDDSLEHVYLIPAHWPEARDLAAELGCRAVLLAEDSGGASFDEAFSTPWTRLAAEFPEHPIPAACLAATIELRGFADVDDETADNDAEALFRVLQRRGYIAGDPGPLPEPACDATRLDACDSITAPAAGVVSYKLALGAKVAKGEVIAELVDPAAEPESARREIRSQAEGLLLSRRSHKFVTPGMNIAKVVGREPLAHRQGYLLGD